MRRTGITGEQARIMGWNDGINGVLINPFSHCEIGIDGMSLHECFEEGLNDAREAQSMGMGYYEYKEHCRQIAYDLDLAA